MEQTEHEFFRSLGLSIMEKRDDGSYIGWPRVSASCNFMKPARYQDILECRLDVRTHRGEIIDDGRRVLERRNIRLRPVV